MVAPTAVALTMAAPTMAVLTAAAEATMTDLSATISPISVAPTTLYLMM